MSEPESVSTRPDPMERLRAWLTRQGEIDLPEPVTDFLVSIGLLEAPDEAGEIDVKPPTPPPDLGDDVVKPTGDDSPFAEDVTEDKGAGDLIEKGEEIIEGETGEETVEPPEKPPERIDPFIGSTGAGQPEREPPTDRRLGEPEEREVDLSKQATIQSMGIGLNSIASPILGGKKVIGGTRYKVLTVNKTSQSIVGEAWFDNPVFHTEKRPIWLRPNHGLYVSTRFGVYEGQEALDANYYFESLPSSPVQFKERVSVPPDGRERVEVHE